MENKNGAAAGQETAEQAERERKKPKQGEKVLPPGGRFITLLFLVFGGLFFWQSMQLHGRDPSLSGYATFPLAVSGLLLFLTVVDFVQNMKMKSANQGVPTPRKIAAFLKYLFPRDALVFLMMAVGYYILLVLGAPFLAASVLFLMGSMCYLIPRNVGKNALYTAVLMAVIYVVFTILFKVTLP